MAHRNLKNMTLEQICEEAELLMPKAHEHVRGEHHKMTMTEDEESRLRDIYMYLDESSSQTSLVKETLAEIRVCLHIPRNGD